MSAFQKLLIANRGEIACRVARTARRMGLQSVAVYSDADAQAEHVRACDSAVHIGASPPKDSYLRGDKMIEAALRVGAAAIHPGYGFLSENAQFAERCAESGLIFVGPPAAAIRAMGSKSAAKTLMHSAGVPLTPGYYGDDQDATTLRAAAESIGYPVLIKASAGGGGKGMRRVDRADDFLAALSACQREAASSFGDDRVLIERYLLRARHIEIQVFADTQGNCVSLFERDCSIQRRHQKVIEEAPAPGMTAARRQQMSAAAVAAARAVNYVGAGTVEFIVDSAGVFYFMEMNTRLQVEHAVTEMITGIDLVEWQLRVAMGESLPLRQEQIAIKGHAVEARLYAEDPANGFLPSTGTLRHLLFPALSPQVRVDAGVRQGDTITPYYDPMIAKLIVWGASRELALSVMQDALAQTQLAGVASNVEFLARVVSHQKFRDAQFDTGFIDREQAELLPRTADAPEAAYLVAALALVEAEQAAVDAACEPGASAGAPWADPWAQRRSWRLNAEAHRTLAFQYSATKEAAPVQEILLQFDAALPGRRCYSLQLAQHRFAATCERVSSTQLRVSLDGVLHRATVIVDGPKHVVFLNDHRYALNFIDPLTFVVSAQIAQRAVRAPMPGRVIALLALPGSRVSAGTPLLIIEAMKMEHTVVAAAQGVLVAYKVAVGEQLQEGADLVDIAP